MAKVGRRTQAQKKAEETKVQRRKNLEAAVDYLVEHFNIKKAEVEKKGTLTDRWHEIYEETKSKNKMIIALYYPSGDKRAIKISTYRDNNKNNLDLELWSEDDWTPFIEESKKYYAFIKRNK
jgi:hypothetical protein